MTSTTQTSSNSSSNNGCQLELKSRAPQAHDSTDSIVNGAAMESAAQNAAGFNCFLATKSGKLCQYELDLSDGRQV